MAMAQSWRRDVTASRTFTSRARYAGAVQPPGGWGPYLIDQLGIEWYRIPIVVLSAVLIYLAFLFLVRTFGARVLTVTSGFDALVFIMLGAVAGRVIIGHPPTVAAGVIGLLTLMVMEAIFGAIERTWEDHRIVSAKPVLVFAHGSAIEAACKKTHTSTTDINSALRRAGISDPHDALCVILEPHGEYSVVRTGSRIDPALFRNVEGAKEHLLGD